MVQGPASGLSGSHALVLGALAGVAHALAQAWPGNGQALGALQVLSLALLAGTWWRATHWRTAAWLGWAFATAQGATGTWWLYISMHQYGGLAPGLAALAVWALAAALALYLALFLGLATALFSRQAAQWQQVMGFGGAWLLAELARAQWFTGFPWVAGGYAHVDSALAVLAPYVGVYGMGLAAALLGALLGAVLALAWTGRGVLMRAGGGVMALATLLALGQPWRAPDPTHAVATVPLTVLQGNVPQDEKYGAQRESAIAWYAEQIQRAPAGLVLAPETAITLPTGAWPESLWRALAPRGADQALMLGVPWQDRDRLSNSVLAWAGRDASGAERHEHRYDKHHLVPFGEFIPWGFGWFVRSMNIPMGEFGRGVSPQASWLWGGLRWAPNICYEDLFGEELARSFSATGGPNVLVNFSNIAWFGDTVAQAQHLNISRLRTLELQRPMVRVTNTGVSAVIDHRAEVQSRLPNWTREVLRTQVTGREGPPTLYARWVSAWGLWPVWVLGALLMLSPALAPKAPRQRWA
jgi:apolipoprotein N-acyltransferase